ncbi:MAG TPA: YHYH protein [Bryobacteraceae bacterium]|jgi:hypothetical protein
MILPILTAWLINPAAHTSQQGLLAVLPEVHAVRSDRESVYVESAGLSLQSLAPITANDREPAVGPRKLVYRFPLHPAPAAGDGERTPTGIVGALLNGVPIYNPVSPASYQDQNLWHLDAVAALARQATTQPSLLASLFSANQRHSPLIGFALDGYPIYGPYGWDAGGKVVRLSSGYRLRAMTRRTTLPDGTELTPSQEGPAVSTEYPLGTFAEDYEYAAGSGDLDAHNGRWTKTPEFPDGTYAYFLSTYPYLVGPTYFGRVEQQKPPDSTLTLSIRDRLGRNIRYLERVHEQPIHLVVVSTDLSQFAHIHPQLQADDTYAVNYTFPRAGSYWVYADYTRPGEVQSISRFRLDVSGPASAPQAAPPADFAVKLSLPSPMRAGADLPLRFDVSVNDLEPYLGAWAHIMIVSEDGQEFIHAHPLDEVGGHTHAAPGPSPSSIRTVTAFRRAGRYKLWVQFQRAGKVLTFPFWLTVEPGTPVLDSESDVEPAHLTFASRAPAGELVPVEIPAAGPRQLRSACGMSMSGGSMVMR